MVGKREKFTIFNLFICNLLLCSLILYGSAQAVCRTDTPTGDPTKYIIYSGFATMKENNVQVDVQVGDVIRAYVDLGDPNEGCIGSFPITSVGVYGPLFLLADDTATPEKDGGVQGETIHFVLCHNEVEYVFDQTEVWDNANFGAVVFLDFTAITCTFYNRDQDQDTYGIDNDIRCLLAQAGEYTANRGGDCNDNNPSIKPGAQEVCDGEDNDCDRRLDLEIADPNNLDLALEEIKEGINKVVIQTLCSSYSSYDFLLNFEELLNIASLNLDRRDDMGNFMSTYFFFGKIHGNNFELSRETSRPNLLMIYSSI